MTVERDPRLDAVLTAPPKEAWQIIFEKLWEIFSAPLTPQHVEQEVPDRERKVSELELLLSSSAPTIGEDTLVEGVSVFRLTSPVGYSFQRFGNAFRFKQFGVVLSERKAQPNVKEIRQF